MLHRFKAVPLYCLGEHKQLYYKLTDFLFYVDLNAPPHTQNKKHYRSMYCSTNVCLHLHNGNALGHLTRKIHFFAICSVHFTIRSIDFGN